MDIGPVTRLVGEPMFHEALLSQHLAPHIVVSIVRSLDANRQSPIPSIQRTRSNLAGHPATSRGTNVTSTNAIARFKLQCSEGEVYK